ncbi:hypothetical protein KSP35_09155 [Aquihabitans sp. G128]|uniref:hypothetical protein n=1 Tax=Aquihabitans sp. G128 TaxID=2849779 RepID=UPI001C22B08A|nr:hypothetical protein [Aquihabitans sp. G128]QXC62927.1 hypothetical protein KSP35_09155 [Aquihabitans sp. G128]
MTDSPSTATAADRLEAGVADVHVPEPSADSEALLLKLGLVLPVIGVVLILIAWWQAAGSKYVADQMPMLISGGIFGLALIIVGLGLFIRFSLARLLRFWLARLVVEQQAQTDRMVDALARIESAVRDATTDVPVVVQVNEKSDAKA